MSSSCQSALSQISLNILSTIIGGIIGFLSATIVSKKNARISACVKFRSIIVPDITKMETDFPDHSTHDLHDMNHQLHGYILEKLPAHLSAIEEFRPFVSRLKKKSFGTACENYARHSKMRISTIEELKGILKFSEYF